MQGSRIAIWFLLCGFFGLQASCGAERAGSDGPRAQSTVPSITVTAAVDIGIVTVGDLVRYTLEVEYDQGILIDALVVPETLGDLEVVESGRNLLRVVRGRAGLVDWIVLRGAKPGSYIIPPVEITGVAADGESHSSESGQVFVEIVSVLPEEAEDIRGLKPLEQEPSRLLWLLAGVAMLLLGFMIWVFKRRGREDEDEVGLLPHEIAFRDLEALRSTDFTDLGQLRRYYYSLSGILRGYIEGRFGLNATDLTSQEIADRLGEIGPLEERQESALLVFNRAVDEVKYAAAVPQETEIEQVYESALGFVEETVPRLSDEAENATEPEQIDGTEASAPQPAAGTEGSRGKLVVGHRGAGAQEPLPDGDERFMP